MAKYQNFVSNLEVLRKAPEQDLQNEFVQSGIIDKFTMQFELAWKLLQKTLAHEGVLEGTIGSPRGIIKSAYSVYDFVDEEVWLQMLEDRNLAEHVYDANLAERLTNQIIDAYIDVFNQMLVSLNALYEKEFLETL